MIEVKLTPKKYIRGEEMWDSKSVNLYAAKEFIEGNLFYRKIKSMNDDLKKATEVSDECLKVFNISLNNLMQKESELSEASKKTSGNIRKAANELAEGLLKLEKTANFSSLEKYVSLLERASNSLTILAELEKNGSLSKITGALK